MAYVTPSTLMTGCLVTAARWNQDVVSNPEALNPGGWSVVLGDGVSVIPTGSALDVEVPFNCTLSAWGIYQSPSGSLEVTLCRMTYAGFPATASVIVGSSPIRSSSALKAQQTTLTSWSTCLSRGDVLRYGVVGASVVTRATVSLQAARV